LYDGINEYGDKKQKTKGNAALAKIPRGGRKKQKAKGAAVLPFALCLFFLTITR